LRHALLLAHALGFYQKRTSTKKNTLFPAWFEVLQLEVDIADDITLAQNLTVQVERAILPRTPDYARCCR